MAAVLTINPVPVECGNVRLGATSRPVPFTLRNAGDVSGTLTSITVTGPFAIVGLTLPITLAPGVETPGQVLYTPTQVGVLETGLLNFFGSLSGSVALRGTGIVAGQLQQERKSEVIGGNIEQFVVTSTYTILGDLPHLNVFVLRIVDRTDPKADTFSRVARIADMTQLPQGRSAGLLSASGVGIEYLQSTVRTTYKDLASAQAGAAAIKDRVNALAATWVDYSTNFAAAPENIPIPYTLLATKQALIETYRQAKLGRKKAQMAAANAADALAAAQSAYNDITAQVTEIQHLHNDLATGDGAVARSAEMTAAANALASLVAASGTALASVAFAAGADKTAFQAQVAIATAANAAAAQGVTNHGNYVAAMGTYLTTLQGTQTAAQTTLTTATTNKAVADAAVTTAVATEAAALSAVQAVCPDFETSSVCADPTA